MKNQKGYTLLGLLFVIVALVAIYGWVANIVKLITIATAASGALEIGLMEILRIIGVFVFPLGTVLGYF